MGEENNEIELLREFAKEWRVILDRMGGDESEAHRRSAISFPVAQSPRLPVDIQPSFGKCVQSGSIEPPRCFAAWLFGDRWFEKIFERICQLIRSR